MLITQQHVRRQFWLDNPNLSRKRIKNYAGTGKMHTTDNRCAFVNYVDHLQRSGIITAALAKRVTL